MCDRTDLPEASVEPCCIQFTLQGSSASCYANGDEGYGICPVSTRASTAEDCQDFLAEYCSRDIGSTFYTKWNPGSVCSIGLVQNALAGNNTTVDEIGYKFLNSYFAIHPLEETSFAYQDRVLQICQETPLACSRYLREKLCVKKTREEISTTDYALKFCGCQLPANQYETFSNSVAGISRECDVICVAPSIVKSVDSQGEIVQCHSTICIIDDVSINLSNSEVGEINFATMCGGCSNSNTSCNCYIKDVDIKTIESSIGAINLRNECDGQLKCYKTVGDTQQEYNCNNGEDIPGGDIPPKPDESYKKTIIIIIIIASVIILFLIILSFSLFTIKKKKKNTKNIEIYT